MGGRILLVALSNWTGLSRLPMAFSRAGYEVTVFAPAGYLIGRSSYAHRVVGVAADPTAFFAALRDFVQAEGDTFRRMLACDDNLLALMFPRRHEAWIQRFWPAPLTDRGMGFLMSKRLFPVICHREGLPVAAFMTGSDRQAAHDWAEKVGFPVVLKEEQGFAGLSVRKLDDRMALEQALDARPPGAPLVLQRYIPGRVGGVCAVWVQGRLKSWFAFLKIHTWPTSFSPASMVRLVDRPRLEPVLHRLGEISGFDGLGGIDFMEQEDGRIFLLEQHARPTPSFLLAADAGIDLARALRAWVEGDAEAPLQSPNNLYRGRLPLFPQEAFRMIGAGREADMRRWLVIPAYRRQLFPDDVPLFEQTLRTIQARYIHHHRAARS